ncbi:MAG TPA: type 1 glutamine amidotransferase [Candidatus Limnocylindrales bacterium]|nr:type 1 glutamine amidotransferase [Candidatus Limnocylindrales bacterium]
MIKIHYLQHVPFEGLASIEQWAKTRGHLLSVTRFYQNEPLPPVDEIDWLVVLGGPMNIYEEDRYPWLSREKRFIEQVISKEKVVLGICLGSQLIADVLGARVFRNRYKEIGWFPIEFTPEAQTSPLFNFLPPRLTAFHWHGDTFELPRGTVWLAQSEGCQNQAFLYKEKVLGLQFHLESTKESVEQLLANCADELVEGRYIQKPDEILSHETDFEKINQALYGILDRMSR